MSSRRPAASSSGHHKSQPGISSNTSAIWKEIIFLDAELTFLTLQEDLESSVRSQEGKGGVIDVAAISVSHI